MNVKHAAMALVALSAASIACTDYIGYSGAPGSNGSCASSCHGGTGGTITVAGFPTVYEVWQSYTISVVKRGGSTISNYNASVRASAGGHTTGAISAGYLTATYRTSGEPNGVHLSGSGDDSSSFIWTAPTIRAGDIKLYLAGQQGGMSGANTELVLTAIQATGVNEGRPVKSRDVALSVEPSVATADIAIRFSVPTESWASLRAIDLNGRLVQRFAVPQSGATRAVSWQPRGADGRRLASGIYFVVLNCDGQRVASKLVIR